MECHCIFLSLWSVWLHLGYKWKKNEKKSGFKYHIKYKNAIYDVVIKLWNTHLYKNIYDQMFVNGENGDLKFCLSHRFTASWRFTRHKRSTCLIIFYVLGLNVLIGLKLFMHCVRALVPINFVDFFLITLTTCQTTIHFTLLFHWLFWSIHILFLVIPSWNLQCTWYSTVHFWIDEISGSDAVALRFQWLDFLCPQIKFGA